MKNSKTPAPKPAGPSSIPIPDAKAPGVISEVPAGPVHRVMVIDDHPVLRMGISLLINSTPGWKVCAEAGTGAEGLERAKQSQPDLILLDLTLPDRNGLDLLKDFQQLLPETPVLILSMHDEMLYAERALRAGARGYVMKETGGAKVIEALQTVMEGRIFVSEKVSSDLLGNLNRRSQAPSKSPLGSLTDREFEIFRLIGDGKSTRVIAEQLGLSPKTVDVHRANIKEKLGVKDLPTLIRQAVCWVEGQRLEPQK